MNQAQHIQPQRRSINNSGRPTNTNAQPTGRQLHATAQRGDVVDQWVDRIRNDRSFRENRIATTDRGIMALASITALLEIARRNFPEQSTITVIETLVGILLCTAIVAGVWLHKQNWDNS